jgi:hypothetical protein
MFEQLLEEAFEGLRSEQGRDGTHELSAAQANGAEAGHGFACGGMQSTTGSLISGGTRRRARAGAGLPEVAFIEAPELDVRAFGEPAQFF